MIDDVKEVNQTFRNLDVVIKPLRDEVEDFDLENDTGLNATTEKTKFARSAEDFQRRYINKMESRCKKQLLKGEKRCQAAFEGARQSCMNKLPSIVNNLLCWPFQITFVCKINFFGNVCDPADKIDPYIGKSYSRLKRTGEELYANNSNVKVNYLIYKPEKPSQLKFDINLIFKKKTSVNFINF